MTTILTTAPIDQQAIHKRYEVCRTDAFKYVAKEVVSQHDTARVLNCIANFVKKHSLVEWYHDIYNTELLVIIMAHEEWQPECKEVWHSLQLLTDHKLFNYILTKKSINGHQVCWFEFLTCFDYKVVSWPGKSHGNADDLSRRPGDHPDWRRWMIELYQLDGCKATEHTSTLTFACWWAICTIQILSL